MRSEDRVVISSKQLYSLRDLAFAKEIFTNVIFGKRCEELPSKLWENTVLGLEDVATSHNVATHYAIPCIFKQMS